VQDTEYRFAAGQNNGRITQMKDWVSGEEVTYSYDSLNRLIQGLDHRLGVRAQLDLRRFRKPDQPGGV